MSASCPTCKGEQWLRCKLCKTTTNCVDCNQMTEADMLQPRNEAREDARCVARMAMEAMHAKFDHGLRFRFDYVKSAQEWLKQARALIDKEASRD